MTEATLVLKIDSREVAQGKRSLDDLNRSGAEAEKTTKGLTTATNTMAKAILAAAAAFATYKLASLIKESTLLAARFETMGIVMATAGNNAGYAAAEMERYSKELQKSGISMLQSRNTLTQLATAHIDLSKAQEIGRAAQNLAVVANINSSEAMATMIRGIKTGRTMILQTMGLNVNFAASYADLAEQIGISVRELSSEQRVLARTNIVLEEAAKFTGIYEKAMETAGKQMLSLDRHIENLKIKLGTIFLPTLSEGVVKYTDALKAANEQLDKWAEEGTIQAWAEQVIPALELVGKLIGITGVMYIGFLLAPAVIGATSTAFGALTLALASANTMGVAWTLQSIPLNASLFGTEVAAFAAASGVNALKTAFGLLGAGLAGVALGNWLMEFDVFRGTVAGIVERVINSFLWLQNVAAKTMVYIQAVFSADILDKNVLNAQLDMLDRIYLRNVLANKEIAEGTRQRIASAGAIDDETRAKQDAADIAELNRLVAVEAERALLEQERAASALVKKQEELLDRLFPLLKAQREYNEHIKTLNKIYPDTLRGHKDHADAVKRLQNEYIELFPELQRQQEEAERMAKAWEEAGFRIDEAFADAWRGAFDSFEDFGDSLLNALKTLLAEMAHMLITKRLVINIAASLGIGGAGSALLGGGASMAAGGGIGGLFAGIGGGLAAASATLAGFLPTGFGGQLGVGGASAASTGIFGPTQTGGNIAGAGGIDFTSLGLGIVGAFAGGAVGSAFGKALFGKEAESAFGQTLGTVVGSFWGPLGSAIGSFIGSIADVAFGGDAQKRYNIGVQTGVQDRDVFLTQIGASGLTLGAKAKRTGQQGREAAEEMLDLFLAMDEQLTMITVAAGIGVNLTGVSLGGKTSEAEGRRGAGFFGSAAMNAVSAAQLEAAPAEFVMAWIDQATKQFAEITRISFVGISFEAEGIPEIIREHFGNLGVSVINETDKAFREIVLGLEGSAQELMVGYANALALRDIFAQGGQLFTDVEGFRETFELLGETFQREGEAIGDTIARLVGSAGLLALLGVLDEFDTASAALGVSVADAVGGVDNLAALTAQFTTLFTTEAEQLEIVQGQLTAVFDNFGIAVPATSEAFESLVTSIDLTQAGSVELLAALLQIAPAFVAVTDAAAAAVLEAEKLAESEAKEALRALALAEREVELATRQAERAARDLARAQEDQARAAQATIDAIIAANSRLVSATAAVQQGFAALFGGRSGTAAAIAVEQSRIEAMNAEVRLGDEAHSDAIRVYNRSANELYRIEMKRYQDSIRAAEALDKAGRSTLLGAETILTPLQKAAEAQRQFDALVSQAMGGDAGAAQEAARFASQLLQIQRDTFASSSEYTDVFRATNETLGRLEGIFGATIEPTAPAILATQGTTSAIITMTDTLANLLAIQAEEQRQADIINRNTQIASFNEDLGELALANAESIFELIASMGLGLDDLAQDINVDGMIDEAERTNAWLALADTNGNLFITEAEAIAAGLEPDSPLVQAIINSGSEAGILTKDLFDIATDHVKNISDGIITLQGKVVELIEKVEQQTAEAAFWGAQNAEQNKEIKTSIDDGAESTVDALASPVALSL